jgi:hypothetical protein
MRQFLARLYATRFPTMAKKTVQLSAISRPDRSLVAQRAYEIWQREGCPEGRDMEHWLRAESELGATNELAGEENLKIRPARRPAKNGEKQFQAAAR